MVAEVLESDHEQLSDLLHQLESSLHLHDAGQIFALLDLFWARLAVHIRAENLCLFPAILDALSESSIVRDDVPTSEDARIAIENLRSDHNFFMDELGGSVKTLREILAKGEEEPRCSEQLNTVRESVNAVSLRLLSHNLTEEGEVYRWPSLLLSESDLEGLEVAVRRELENLPARFCVQ